jgi:hypothetical protein
MTGHQMGYFQHLKLNPKLTNQCNGLRNWAQTTVGTVVKGSLSLTDKLGLLGLKLLMGNQPKNDRVIFL